MPRISRRQMLSTSTACLLASRARPGAASAPAPAFVVDRIRTVSLQSDRYHGWPTMIRRRNGELLVVCSGGRESHVCPFGRVELIRSYDDGESWTYARTLLDGPIDDRDAGIVETARGTLLVTTFTSLAYEPGLVSAITAAEQGTPKFCPQNWHAGRQHMSNCRWRTFKAPWLLDDPIGRWRHELVTGLPNSREQSSRAGESE